MTEVLCVVFIALFFVQTIVLLLIQRWLYMIAHRTKKGGKRGKKLKRFLMKCKAWIKLLLDLILSWLIKPIRWIVPVKKGLVLFMGRQNSGFLDNDKYLLIYLMQTGQMDKYDIWFMGHRDRVVYELKKYGIKTENYFSLKTYWLLLRADVIITDNAHWTTHNRYNIARKAHKIQLWHGIGFKKIRLSDPDFVEKSKGLKGYLKYVLQGQLATYDTFVSTSEFFSKNVFNPSFEPKEIVNLGYCRNDILFNDFPFNEELVKINTDILAWQRIRELKGKGNKIVIYSPTFRNAKTYSVKKTEVDFDLLDEFGRANNIVFVFKLHPLPQNTVKMSHYQNIVEYNSKCDIYPLFELSDMMVTDYSSIYLDYVMTDKPIAFFMYDLEYYTTSCRGIREDFAELLPGKKCLTQEALMDVVYDSLVLGVDAFSEERKLIRDMAWEYQDGQSCKRVWDYIEHKYLLDENERDGIV